MNITEAIKKLDNISEYDPETAHVDAEDVIMDFLKSNGFSELVDAWDRLVDRCDGFWYA